MRRIRKHLVSLILRHQENPTLRKERKQLLKVKAFGSREETRGTGSIKHIQHCSICITIGIEDSLSSTLTQRRAKRRRVFCSGMLRGRSMAHKHREGWRRLKIDAARRNWRTCHRCKIRREAMRRRRRDGKSKETVGLLLLKVGWRVVVDRRSIAKIAVSNCSHLQQCGEGSEAPAMQNGGRGNRKTRR
jgi:hypothetical protein